MPTQPQPRRHSHRNFRYARAPTQGVSILLHSDLFRGSLDAVYTGSGLPSTLDRSNAFDDLCCSQSNQSYLFFRHSYEHSHGTLRVTTESWPELISASLSAPRATSSHPPCLRRVSTDNHSEIRITFTDLTSCLSHVSRTATWRSASRSKMRSRTYCTASFRRCTRRGSRRR